jgi:enoyl-CoA hydratase
MNFETILYKKERSLVTVTLNRPDRGNALNRKLTEELEKAIDNVEKDSEAKVLILSGEGKGFCAGADTSEINFDSVQATEAFIKMFQVLFNRLEDIEKPTIASINGFAVGGGCELALACDVRIASDKASIGVPEIKMGFLPGAGGTQRLPRLVGPGNALEMLFTGEKLDAHQAYRIGLFNKVVPHEILMEETMKFAEILIQRSAQALKMAKKLVRIGMNMDLKSALELEMQVVSQLSFDAIRKQMEGRGA